MTDHVFLQIDAKSNAGIATAMTAFTITTEIVATLVEKGLLSREKGVAFSGHAQKMDKAFRMLRMAHHPARAEEKAELFFGVLQMLMQIMAWVPAESVMEVKAAVEDLIENQMKQKKILDDGRSIGTETNKKKSRRYKGAVQSRFY